MTLYEKILVTERQKYIRRRLRQIDKEHGTRIGKAEQALARAQGKKSKASSVRDSLLAELASIDMELKGLDEVIANVTAEQKADTILAEANSLSAEFELNEKQLQ